MKTEVNDSHYISSRCCCKDLQQQHGMMRNTRSSRKTDITHEYTALNTEYVKMIKLLGGLKNNKQDSGTKNESES